MDLILYEVFSFEVRPLDISEEIRRHLLPVTYVSLCFTGTASVARAWSSTFDSLVEKKISGFFKDSMSIPDTGKVLADYPDLFALILVMLLTGENNLWYTWLFPSPHTCFTDPVLFPYFIKYSKCLDSGTGHKEETIVFLIPIYLLVIVLLFFLPFPCKSGEFVCEFVLSHLLRCRIIGIWSEWVCTCQQDLHSSQPGGSDICHHIRLCERQHCQLESY